MKRRIEFWVVTFLLYISFLYKIVETKATISECARRRHQCNNGFALSSIGVVPASPFSNCKWKSISTGGGYCSFHIAFFFIDDYINMIFFKLLHDKKKTLLLLTKQICLIWKYAFAIRAKSNNLKIKFTRKSQSG